MFRKKVVLRIFAIHRKTPVPGSEFCEISNDTFSYRTPPVAASVTRILKNLTRGDHFWQFSWFAAMNSCEDPF